jgi:hypothetical protein
MDMGGGGSAANQVTNTADEVDVDVSARRSC